MKEMHALFHAHMSYRYGSPLRFMLLADMAAFTGCITIEAVHFLANLAR